MDPARFSFEVRSSRSDVGLIVSVDQQILLDVTPVQEKQKIDVIIKDLCAARHSIELSMYGKSPDMTRVDSNGNIIEDATLTIDSIHIDDIDISSMVIAHADYYHDYNGTKSCIVRDKFYGIMGCNGTVYIDFSVPIYTWLLENL